MGRLVPAVDVLWYIPKTSGINMEPYVEDGRRLSPYLSMTLIGHHLPNDPPLFLSILAN